MQSELPNEKRGLLNESRRFHRRLGMAFAIFFIFSSITGVLLNHSLDLELDHHQVPAFIARAYFNQIEVSPGFRVGESWVYSLGGSLWYDQAGVGGCGNLRSVAGVEDQIFALCDDDLLVMTGGGELIEIVSGFGKLSSLGRWGQKPVGKWGDEIFEIDPMTFQLSALELSTLNSSQLAASSVTPEPGIHWLLADKLDDEIVNTHLPDISFEKWILDLHSGRYFGGPGVLFLDIVAVLLVLAACTGLYMSFSPKEPCEKKES